MIYYNLYNLICNCFSFINTIDHYNNVALLVIRSKSIFRSIPRIASNKKNKRVCHYGNPRIIEKPELNFGNVIFFHPTI